MLRKKEAYTVITPIPGFIPRQLALDILHSHPEVITLNPLVLDHKPIPAPRTAAADEYYSTWYEITERVQVLPGAGKLGSSKITFNGCFHDMPWGLQTHIYAPMNIDLRNKYRIGGNQPGLEPPEVKEMGLIALGAPTDGLYLREDIEIRCNITMVSFVKKELKAASKEMVGRIIRKAELLDAGVLKAMMTPDGRITTINPNDRSQTFSQQQQQQQHHTFPPTSPSLPTSSPSPGPGGLGHSPTLMSSYSRQGSIRPQSHHSAGSPMPNYAQPYHTPSIHQHSPSATPQPYQIPGKDQVPQQFQAYEMPASYNFAPHDSRLHPGYAQTPQDPRWTQAHPNPEMANAHNVTGGFYAELPSGNDK
ncbi:unnamed protein product [Clonostachys rhizophaga]|uniref:DUF7053 domain-containing protein n=1 Tax=Clonostachys rhizophaga TaxID=160324 RepID=A0A9N9YMN9_9HYPO|nr:unnamed protein product [Clonostachys rhizophaga]